MRAFTYFPAGLQPPPPSPPPLQNTKGVSRDVTPVSRLPSPYHSPTTIPPSETSLLDAEKVISSKKCNFCEILTPKWDKNYAKSIFLRFCTFCGFFYFWHTWLLFFYGRLSKILNRSTAIVYFFLLKKYSQEFFNYFKFLLFKQVNWLSNPRRFVFMSISLFIKLYFRIYV